MCEWVGHVAPSYDPQIFKVFFKGLSEILLASSSNKKSFFVVDSSFKFSQWANFFQMNRQSAVKYLDKIPLHNLLSTPEFLPTVAFKFTLQHSLFLFMPLLKIVP